jgi:hypothetical protein
MAARKEAVKAIVGPASVDLGENIGEGHEPGIPSGSESASAAFPKWWMAQRQRGDEPGPVIYVAMMQT